MLCCFKDALKCGEKPRNSTAEHDKCTDCCQNKCCSYKSIDWAFGTQVFITFAVFSSAMFLLASNDPIRIQAGIGLMTSIIAMWLPSPQRPLTSEERSRFEEYQSYLVQFEQARTLNSEMNEMTENCNVHDDHAGTLNDHPFEIIIHPQEETGEFQQPETLVSNLNSTTNNTFWLTAITSNNDENGTNQQFSTPSESSQQLNNSTQIQNINNTQETSNSKRSANSNSERHQNQKTGARGSVSSQPFSRTQTSRHTRNESGAIAPTLSRHEIQSFAQFAARAIGS